MTRITNFGRKRTYVQAGFADPSAPKNDESSHKRRKSINVPSDDSPLGIDGDASVGYEAFNKRKLLKKNITDGPHRSEARRLKRVTQRQADTVCFMCRDKGHTAKGCPKASAIGGNVEGSKTAVGICYRCGSKRHTLSRCKKPEDSLNPLPFAACFVCSKKGHLASTCPKNADKGVYPNGGCCKLCGEKTHLAKDCTLRKHDQSGTAAGAIFGIGRDAGADEDDFHAFKRNNGEVSKSEKDDSKQRKQLGRKVGAHTGTVKSFTPGRSKKVVYF